MAFAGASNDRVRTSGGILMAVVSDLEPACRSDNSGACLRLHVAHIGGRGNALD